uniref:Ribosomal protein S11 n=1 Tax=Malawimonas californiana TaxID=221722 RepID=A0A0B5GSE6_MALCL|nr:ribosomal protein S11 [Malawimonas californiana]AJF22875.1 ribosomal protein S11 [Malawimonas californiana]
MTIKGISINKQSNKQIKFKTNKYIKYKIFNIYIKTTLNNTFITLTDIKGQIKATCSGGKLGYKGSKRSTVYATENILLKILKTCLNSGVKKVQLFFNGIGKPKKMFIKLIRKNGIKIIALNDITPIPYNGCRLPKKRRV